jgi:hypothetical protein
MQDLASCWIIGIGNFTRLGLCWLWVIFAIVVPPTLWDWWWHFGFVHPTTSGFGNCRIIGIWGNFIRRASTRSSGDTLLGTGR